MRTIRNLCELNRRHLVINYFSPSKIIIMIHDDNDDDDDDDNGEKDVLSTFIHHLDMRYEELNYRNYFRKSI